MNLIGTRVKSKGWIPYLVYALLSLAILGALLKPGYILNLDMVFAPSEAFTNWFYGVFESWYVSLAPFWLLQQLTTKVVPAWLWQKAILFLIFFLCGLGAHRLFPFKGAGSYFAGLLYAVNPFTYVRFMAGNWDVLAAYALTPFAIKAFIELLERRDKRNAIKMVVLTTLAGVFKPHWLIIIFLAFLVIFIFFIFSTALKNPPPGETSGTLLGGWAIIGQASKYVGIGAAMFIGLNLYWFVPVLTTRGALLEQIGQQDLIAFAPIPTSSSGIMFDIASMYGFWRNGYIYAIDLLPFWWLLFIFILFLAVYGFVCNYRERGFSSESSDPGRPTLQARSFAGLAVIAFILAVGTATQFTRPLFEWLWEQLPFFKGFRDSQKFVSLLCLSYAFLGGLGVNEFASGLKERGKLPQIGLIALITLALLAPPIYSFTIFGSKGQLGVTDYPKGWYEVNDYLNEDKHDFNVLFLPWHLYMDYSWLPNQDKRLANPAMRFFDKPVIAGDNIELPGVYSQSPEPVSKYVEFLLRKGGDIRNLGELLAPLNVRYVILVHEVDYQIYNFLYRQEDLAIELEKPGITLFKNEHPTHRFYGVDSVVYIENLEEYVELSQTQDVTEHLYLLKSGTSDEVSAEISGLDFVQKSPVRYRVEDSQSKYIIFTMPQTFSANHWECNGEQSVGKNLSLMPAFESVEGGGEVIYTKFYRVYLPAYIISLAVLASMVWCFFHISKRGGQ